MNVSDAHARYPRFQKTADQWSSVSWKARMTGNGV